MTEERCCQRQAHPLLGLELGGTRRVAADTIPIGYCADKSDVNVEIGRRKGSQRFLALAIAAVMEQVESFKFEQDHLHFQLWLVLQEQPEKLVSTVAERAKASLVQCQDIWRVEIFSEHDQCCIGEIHEHVRVTRHEVCCTVEHG